MVIYKITNTKDGKFYIGKTKHTAEDRWQSHLQDRKYSDTKFYRALNCHGPEFFIVETIENGIKTEQELNERECFWIDSLKPEYNTAKGGTGGLIGTGQLGKTWKIHNTSNMKSKKTVTEAVIEGRKRGLIGGANYQCIYFIHTPWGVFETWESASKAAKELRAAGQSHIITDEATIKQYCLEDKTLNKEGRRTPKEWRGKSTKSIGFYVTLKENHGKTESQ